ncbi:hypothetical protein JW813_06790 [Clostridium botulinum]|uniref:hypothetical protein n=1 Tax=Clostridium botulinum TaxID=1491 RepID=UPI002245488B|nr:hypothetical protein [Clostridium botulinum]UZP04711.1 hypothetical protein JW813_06790 [Clostridium botulinum]UZP08123.1 hypothetical protein JYA71_07065 [Clostridium botulinum]UZP11450.1 hypothetical protein JYA74_06785 [Clostridium botulinum]
MKKIYLNEQLEELKKYPVEVINSIYETVEILEENYGVRDVEKDLGGYVLIVEKLDEIKRLKEGKLQDLIPEYVDIIKCNNGIDWVSMLFLLSSDFSIVVVTTEEFSKYL